MALENLNNTKHWRERAAQMRALSDGMNNAEARAIMLQLATDYDKLADRAEDRAAKGDSFAFRSLWPLLNFRLAPFHTVTMGNLLQPAPR